MNEMPPQHNGPPTIPRVCRGAVGTGGRPSAPGVRAAPKPSTSTPRRGSAMPWDAQPKTAGKCWVCMGLYSFFCSNNIVYIVHSLYGFLLGLSGFFVIRITVIVIIKIIKQYFLGGLSGFIWVHYDKNNNRNRKKCKKIVNMIISE